MAWSRFEPGFSRHPKRLKSGPAASWLWACSVDHCTEFRTDGFIDEAAVAALCPAMKPAERTRAIQALLGVQSWTQAKGGYHVHGYLEHNPSAEEVEADRRAGRRRYEDWKSRRRRGPTSDDPTESQTHSQQRSNGDATAQQHGCQSVGRSVGHRSQPTSLASTPETTSGRPETRAREATSPTPVASLIAGASGDSTQSSDKSLISSGKDPSRAAETREPEARKPDPQAPADPSRGTVPGAPSWPPATVAGRVQPSAEEQKAAAAARNGLTPEQFQAQIEEEKRRRQGAA